MTIVPSKAHAFVRFISLLLEHYGFTQTQIESFQSPIRNWVQTVTTACTVKQLNGAELKDFANQLIQAIEEPNSCALEVPPHFNEEYTSLFEQIAKSFRYAVEGLPVFPPYQAKMVVALIQANTEMAETPPSVL